jgi:predicted RNase H-like HicB family nuclease
MLHFSSDAGAGAANSLAFTVYHWVWHGSLIALGSLVRIMYRASKAMAGPTTRHLDFTAVYRKLPEGYIGFIEELPGANTQGRTLDEVRSNLREATELILEANRDLARQNMDEAEVIREPLRIAAE